MDAISAIESIQNVMPNVTIRFPQIPPAVLPFVSGITALIRASTQALPKMRLYPKMERKRKLRRSCCVYAAVRRAGSASDREGIRTLFMRYMSFSSAEVPDFAGPVGAGGGSSTARTSCSATVSKGFISYAGPARPKELWCSNVGLLAMLTAVPPVCDQCWERCCAVQERKAHVQ